MQDQNIKKLTDIDETEGISPIKARIMAFGGPAVRQSPPGASQGSNEGVSPMGIERIAPAEKAKSDADPLDAEVLPKSTKPELFKPPAEVTISHTESADDEEEDYSSPVNQDFLDSILKTSSTFSNGTSLEQEKMDERRVQFSGIEESFPTIEVLQNETTSKLIERLNNYRQLLVQAQIDLSGEKAIRRRKDKNLVKLAKELQKRSREIESKNSQITTMVAMVREIEEKLNASEKSVLSMKNELESAKLKHESSIEAHRRELSELETQHLRTCTSLRQELDIVKEKYHEACNLLESTPHKDIIVSLQRDLEATETKYKNQTTVLERRIEELTAECSEVTAKLRGKITELDLENQELSVKLALLEKGSVRGGAQVSTFAKLMLLAAGMAIFAVVAAFKGDGFFVMNVACSPSLPGTKLIKNMEAEAPWWAPKSLKERAFYLCEPSIRTRLTMQDGKVTAYGLDKESTKQLWRKSANEVRIHADQIEIHTKKGVEYVNAPWSR